MHRSKAFLLATAWLAAAPLAQTSVPKKELTKADERKFQEEQARASRLSHHIAAESARKRSELMERFRIQPSTDSCLAYNRSAQACAVSVGDFNGTIGAYLPDSLENVPESQYSALAGKARSIALDALLDKAYLQDLQATGKVPDAREPDPGDDTEEATADSAQAALFREYFPSLLAADRDFRVKVLASTDSALLDSLLRSGAERSVLNAMTPQSLPPEAARDLIGLRQGSWSRIRKVAFGYLALSPSKRPPDLAHSRRLLSLLAKPPAGSRRSASAREYYRHNPGEFAAKDTLDLRVRLVPKPNGYKAVGKPSRLPGEPEILPTGMVPRTALRLASTALPAPVASYAERRLGNPQSDSIGPVQLEYGLWTFVLLGRKQGRGLLTFEEAGPLLDARMRALAADDRFREAISGARSKSENANLDGIRSALMQEQEGSGGTEAPFQAFARGKRAWIAENILLAYKLEE
jgi:hypothetical protein